MRSSRQASARPRMTSTRAPPTARPPSTADAAFGRTSTHDPGERSVRRRGVVQDDDELRRQDLRLRRIVRGQLGQLRPSPLHGERRTPRLRCVAGLGGGGAEQRVVQRRTVAPRHRPGRRRRRAADRRRRGRGIRRRNHRRSGVRRVLAHRRRQHRRMALAALVVLLRRPARRLRGLQPHAVGDRSGGPLPHRQGIRDDAGEDLGERIRARPARSTARRPRRLRVARSRTTPGASATVAPPRRRRLRTPTTSRAPTR